MLQISNNKFYFAKSLTDEDGFIQIIIPQGSYETESLNNEIKRDNIDEEQLTEADYPFPTFQHLDPLWKYTLKDQ